MAEYIEREKALKILEDMRLDYENSDCPVHALCEDYMDALETAEDKLNMLIAADVRPERHGEWIFDKPNAIGYFPVKCSNCGFKIATTGCPCDWINEPDHVYCGACGAKMDGKDGKNNA